MSIIVGQAAYGEKDRGHALLGASELAGDTASAIVARMDVQGTVPPGLTWSPYWSGFPEGQFYILARTGPDPAAERAGMVRSRALFIPLEQLAGLDYIASALDFLEHAFDASPPYDDVPLPHERDGGDPHFGLAAALTEFSGRPMVWAYDIGFEAALKNLWLHLWPEARATFTFRQSFSPQDVTDGEEVLVTTLPSLAQRWTGSRLVRTLGSAPSAAAGLLAGDASGAKLAAFKASLEARMTAIADLTWLEEVRSSLDGIADLADGISALRLVERLSPDRAAGREPKAKLLKSCIEAMPSAEASVIRMARNLKLDAFETSPLFWQAVRLWTKEQLWRNDVSSVSTVLNDALVNQQPVAEWRAAVTAGVKDAMGGSQSPFIAAVWAVIAVTPEMLRPLMAIGNHCAKVERALVRYAPRKLAPAVAVVLLSACAELELRDLHAACCAAAYDPGAAASRHMAEVGFTKASLVKSLSRAADKDIVAIALVQDSEELLEIAAERCADRPSLLTPLEIEDARWRRLWREALQRNSESWAGPRQPQEKAAALIDALMDAHFVDEPLLVALASTPLANLTSYARRSEAWPYLPAEPLERMLEATSLGWIDEYIARPRDEAPEPVLANEIMRPAKRDRLLSGLRDNPIAGCTAFRIFGQLDEGHFTHWLNEVLACKSSLTIDEAEALGRLVAARSWRTSATTLAQCLAGGREDLRPGVRYCIDLVGWLLQYEVDMIWSGSPAEAKWRTLEEIALQLYGYGPGEHRLWERAGGKKGDIPNARTGSEAWRQVIGDIENGKRKIDPRKLIQTMAEDHPRNPTLGKMRRDHFYK